MRLPGAELRTIMRLLYIFLKGALALADAGHEVDLLDLYAEKWRDFMAGSLRTSLNWTRIRIRRPASCPSPVSPHQDAAARARIAKSGTEPL
jgi:hypothetical protein